MQNIAHEVFLLMLALSRVRDPDTVRRLFLEGMNAVLPGVRLRYLDPGENPPGEIIDARTASGDYGRVLLEAPPDGLPAEYLAVFRTAVAMFAVMIERARYLVLQADENVRALRDREAALAEAMRIARVGNWEWDIQRDVVAQSSQASTNLDSASAPPASLSDFLSHVHPEDRPVVRERLRACLETGERYECTFRVATADGSERFVLAAGELICDGAGTPLMLRGVGQDITQQRLLEQQFLRAQRLDSMGRLAGSVAHDFNNLLTVINGYAEMVLLRLREADPVRPGVEQILAAGRRARSLTQQLLAFSRDQVLAPRVLDINQVTEGMAFMLERLAGESIRLRLNPSAEACTVHIDPIQLEQVVMNLAVNARDAMPEGGLLTISTEREPEDRPAWVSLIVQDTGMGMDQATQSRIFEPFFTTKTQGRGTGLGLSIVYGVVRQSGGSVNLVSAPGQGATFTLRFPFVTGAPAPKECSAVASPATGHGVVLLVEDEPSVRDLCAAMVTRCGYDVLVASSAEEALRLCAELESLPDLLLTDVVMPGMNGVALAAALRARQPELRVVFISSRAADAMDQAKAQVLGAVFLSKPFALEDLATVLQATLGAGSRKVLVVDDEEGIRRLFEQVLSDAGYEVAVASDGEQAQKALGNGAFDLVVMDLVMPNREGIETIRAVRRAYPGLKVIAVSGAFGGELLRTAAMLGADATLAKPVSSAQLLETVCKVLG